MTMKDKILNLWHQIPRGFFSILLTLICALILLAQFAANTGYIARVADHGAIVGIQSDDASNAIQVALRSQWWNNNDFMPYGPVYFRLANSIRQLVPWSGFFAAGTIEARETAVHFSLLFVSLLAAVALAGTLAAILCERKDAWLILTAVLTATLLADPVWSKMLLMAHPDFLFAYVIALAFLSTLQALHQPESSFWFKTAALLWGVAAATKLTIVLFVPVLLIVWGRPWRRENLRTTWRFGLWILFGFLLIGFPQNFLVPKMIKFLMRQSTLSVRPGLEDLLDWGRLFGTQLWRPALFLVLAALLLPRRTDMRFLYDRKTLSRGALLIAVPTLWMISRKVLSPYDYYPMPFCALLLVMLALLLRQTRAWVPVAKVSLGILTLVLACRFVIGFVPQSLAETAESMQACRPEARQVYGQIQALVGAGKKTYVDPYVPSPTGATDALVRSWHMTWPEFSQAGFRAAVLRSSYYARYLADPPSSYVTIENPNWAQVRDFYRLFQNQTETRDPEGHLWRRTHHDACELEIWERVD